MTFRESPLDLAPRGTLCRILRLTAQGAVRQRLLDMGLMPDSAVEIVRAAPLGDPLELRIGESDQFLALRRSEAAQILVTPWLP